MGSILYKVVKDGLSDEMTFEQRHEGSEGESTEVTWDKSVSYWQMEEQCKGPELRECLACYKIRKEPNMGEQRGREIMVPLSKLLN